MKKIIWLAFAIPLVLTACGSDGGKEKSSEQTNIHTSEEILLNDSEHEGKETPIVTPLFQLDYFSGEETNMVRAKDGFDELVGFYEGSYTSESGNPITVLMSLTEDGNFTMYEFATYTKEETVGENYGYYFSKELELKQREDRFIGENILATSGFIADDFDNLNLYGLEQSEFVPRINSDGLYIFDGLGDLEGPVKFGYKSPEGFVTDTISSNGMISVNGTKLTPVLEGMNKWNEFFVYEDMPSVNQIGVYMGEDAGKRAYLRDAIPESSTIMTNYHYSVEEIGSEQRRARGWYENFEWLENPEEYWGYTSSGTSLKFEYVFRINENENIDSSYTGIYGYLDGLIWKMGEDDTWDNLD